MQFSLGLVLSVLTAALWGTFPIALRPVVEVVDPFTLTWCRYLVSAVGMGTLLAYQGQLPTRQSFVYPRWVFLLIAYLCFAANNFGFLWGLRLTTPSTAQIVIQLAPLLVIFGAVRWFGEHFGARQWIGVAVLPCGLLLFFHQKLTGSSDSFGRGLLLLIGCAFLWASYALAQKRLIRDMNSVAVMGIIYAAGTVLMLPVIDLSHLVPLDNTRWWFLCYCCLMTLVSNACFSEALAVWPASRVSAVVATTPLFTVVFTRIAAFLWPGYIVPEALDALSVTGAGVVVFGCILMALRK